MKEQYPKEIIQNLLRDQTCKNCFHKFDMFVANTDWCSQKPNQPSLETCEKWKGSKKQTDKMLNSAVLGYPTFSSVNLQDALEELKKEIDENLLRKFLQ